MEGMLKAVAEICAHKTLYRIKWPLQWIIVHAVNRLELRFYCHFVTNKNRMALINFTFSHEKIDGYGKCGHGKLAHKPWEHTFYMVAQCSALQAYKLFIWTNWILKGVGNKFRSLQLAEDRNEWCRTILIVGFEMVFFLFALYFAWRAPFNVFQFDFITVNGFYTLFVFTCFDRKN